MRVCIVSRHPPSQLADAHARYAWEAATALIAAGHEVHLLTAGSPDARPLPSAPAAPPPGAALHTVDTSTGPAAIPQAFPTPEFRHAMGVYSALLDLHEHYAFDYIEFPLAGGEGYFAIRGKRTLGQFAGAVLGVRLCTPASDGRRENLDSRFDGETAFVDHMERASLREADLLVSPTIELVELVRERLRADPAWPTPAVAVVAPPRAAQPIDGAWAPSAGPMRVVFVGPLEARRGVRTFAEAGAELLEREPDLKLELLGPDTDTAPIGRPMRAFLEARCGLVAGDRCVMGDPPASVAELGAAAAVCFPGAMHEPEWLLHDALALGVPVIAAETPFLRGLAGPRLRLIPPNDAAALGSAVREAIRDPGAAPPSRVPAPFTDELFRAVAAARSPTQARAEAPAGPADGPDVSIIVTVYNLGRYLPETLASIDIQTLASREVIIVDDGSTDAGTIALLDRLEAEGRRIIRGPNRGCAAARNTGLRAARGRWVVFIDADDLIEPTYLETLAAPLRSNPRLGYASSLVRCFENDDPTVATAGWVPLGMAGFDSDLLLCMNVGGIGAGSLFDRAALLEVGGYDDRMPSYEDWELWCRLAQRGIRGAIIPRFMFSYRVRSDSKYRRQGLARHAQLKSHLLAHHAALPRRGGGGLVSARTLLLHFAEAAAAEVSLREVSEQLHAARAALKEADERTDVELLRRLDEAQRSAAEAWRNAGELEETLKRTAESLAKSQANASSLQAQREADTRRAEALRCDVDAAQASAAALARRLADADALTARTDAELQRQSAERARLADRLDLATTQTLLTGDRLARALADLAAAEQTVADLRRQLAEHDCSVHTRHVLAGNVRYRMADRVNSAIRGTGVHSIAKAIARRTVAGEGDAGNSPKR